MTLPRALVAVALAAACALSTAACSSDPEEVETARAALAPVQEEVANLPGIVSATVDVRSITGIENAAAIDVSIVTEATTMQGLIEHGRAAVEAVWSSSVPAIDTVTLRARPEDPALTDADGNRLQVLESIGHDQLASTYGPRPDDR